MSILPACMHVHHVHAWYLQRSEEGIGSPRTRVTDGCEPLSEFKKLNPGSLQDQQVC